MSDRLVWSKSATIREMYGPAMEVRDADEARAYFEALVLHNMKHWGQDRAEAESVMRQNLGYYAGYYNRDTRERVERLFNCAHPIFGKASDGMPTPETALLAGVFAARKTQ